MNKSFKVTALVALLLVALSAVAFAAPTWKEDVADFTWGKKAEDSKGNWGFVYTQGYDDEGNWEEDGLLQPYLKFKKDVYNKRVVGPYVEDGQNLTTIWGSRLGINYSKYVAAMHKDSAVAGIRVYPINVSFGDLIDIDIDASYILGTLWVKEGWAMDPFVPSRKDIILGANGNIWELDLNTAVVRYWVEGKDEDGSKKDFFNYNFSVEAGLNDLVPGLSLNAVYAAYLRNDEKAAEGEDSLNGWLYEVTAEYEAIPGLLAVRAGHRNSEMPGITLEENGKIKTWANSVLGNNGKDKERYVQDSKPIAKIFNRNNSINVGATVWYDFAILDGVLENQFDIDYDTTNPNRRNDLDDVITLKADSKFLGYGLWQKFGITMPDDETPAGVREHQNIVIATDNRLDYGVKFTTPDYALPVPFVNDFFVNAKVNFDWDQNYVAKADAPDAPGSRSQAIVGVEVGTALDIVKAKNVQLGASLFYDMPSDKTIIEDAFKFALISRYDAPNGIKFRVEYQSSIDFTSADEWVHDDDLNDRYADFRYYENSKFHGLRFAVGVPF